jgi:hypothetical protein
MMKHLARDNVEAEAFAGAPMPSEQTMIQRTGCSRPVAAAYS